MAMCFKDRSFCAASSLCTTAQCHDKLTPELRDEAEEWAKEWQKPYVGAPIWWINYAPTCPDFKPDFEVV